MTLLYLVSALLAAGAYFLTRRLRRWVRIMIALTVFILLAVIPTVLLMAYPDHRLPGARTVTQEELERAASPTSGGGP